MTFPMLTAYYGAVLGLIYAALTIFVVTHRVRTTIAFGDGGDARLMTASRIHGNFVEYVPFILLLLAGVEVLGGASDQVIRWLAGGLVAARVLHVIGLMQPVGTPIYFAGRVIGTFATWLILIATSVLLLMAANTAGVTG